MTILTLRTDKPEAELGLYSDRKQLAFDKWEANRELARTLHERIFTNLKRAGKDWHDIKGVVVYMGPGSFTGLRIGLALVNALASDLEIPIVGTTGTDWLDEGIDKLLAGQNDGMVLPEYGASPHITKPKISTVNKSSYGATACTVTLTDC